MPSTRVIKIDFINPQEGSIKEAAHILKKGGLVIIPTETVYGIAANIQNETALSRLHQLKQRPANKPFSLIIAEKEDVEMYASDISAAAYRLMENFWPGPLTLVLKGTNSKIGLRMPDHKVALAIIKATGSAIACPSANHSGNPPPRTAWEALKDLDGLVDLVVDSGMAKIGVESTVVDATELPVQILRVGAITKTEIEKTANAKNILFVCTGNSCRSVMASALLEKKLKEIGRSDIKVSSAGIMMVDGLPPSEQTKELLDKEGMDVSGYRSRRITKEMIRRADIILAMEKLHEQRILQLSPEAKNRVFLLKEFAKIKHNDLDIEDPIARSMEFYEQIFSVIKESIEKIAEII